MTTGLVWGLGVVTMLSLAACGHPASQVECEEIVDRIVDLELRAQNVTDPTELAKRRTSTLSASGLDKSSVLHECVGKNITDRAMRCVRGAKAAEEITDTCLR